jgi:hypothetical protein
LVVTDTSLQVNILTCTDRSRTANSSVTRSISTWSAFVRRRQADSGAGVRSCQLVRFAVRESRIRKSHNCRASHSRHPRAVERPEGRRPAKGSSSPALVLLTSQTMVCGPVQICSTPDPSPYSIALVTTSLIACTSRDPDRVAAVQALPDEGSASRQEAFRRPVEHCPMRQRPSTSVAGDTAHHCIHRSDPSHRPIPSTTVSGRQAAGSCKLGCMYLRAVRMVPGYHRRCPPVHGVLP